MIRLGELDARTSAAGLGGWTLSVHHTLGLETGTLYLGTGEKRDLGDSRRPVAVRVAGNGDTVDAATGPSAVGAAVANPQLYGAATIPSEDGSELYEFDERGRHLRTLNGLTNDVVWSFHYDAQGRLIRVDDAYGDPSAPVRASYQHGGSPCRSMPRLRSRR